MKLTGEGGLLGRLAKVVVESALEGDMNDHLSYCKHDAAGRNGGALQGSGRALGGVACCPLDEATCSAILTVCCRSSRPSPPPTRAPAQWRRRAGSVAGRAEAADEVRVMSEFYNSRLWDLFRDHGAE